ncbi:uncharacterized protein K02A2.6-like [Zophobas morio]|uniref:uncharacterized protein K02A2.6-like n=1 Tax=Zophobas morio TaxID=2755281 RepID=UPI003083E23E
MASANALPRLVLNNGGNTGEQWKQWLSSFQIYLIATEVNKKEETIQIAQLLHFAGPEAQKIHSTFKFAETERNKLAAVIDKFNNHFTPRQNLTFTRYKFFKTKQNEMSLEEFITELRKQAQNCHFGDLCDELIKLVFISGTNNEEIRHKLLQEDDADLEKAIKLSSIIEQSKSQANKMRHSCDKDGDLEQVDRVGFGGQRYSPASASQGGSGNNGGWQGSTREVRQGQSRARSKSRNRGPSTSSGSGRNFITNCTRCGRSHPINKCPAYKKTCGKCKKTNHFASMCRADRNINALINSNSTLDEDVLYIGTINNVVRVNDVTTHNAWTSNLKINNIDITFKLDTGAMANILPVQNYLDLNIPLSLIKPSKITLKSYTGDKLPLLGHCQLNCQHQNNTYNLRFYVINDSSEPLLGLNTCIELELITKNEAKSEIKDSKIINTVENCNQVPLNDKITNSFGDVFTGIGCINPLYHIQIEENAQPIISPIRRVPFALMDQLKLTLNKLESMKIIQRVDGPSSWVHPLVIVKKGDGSLRICMDPLHLNKVIKREHCQLLTMEEITSKLHGAKYFSKLDANQAFYQIPLDEASSDLCTVGTPYGRYKFLRLPYGIKCAPEVFNDRFRNIFNLPNVAVYIDDIIIWGNSREEHDKILNQVLEIARKNNIKFNYSKCKFGVQTLKFMGHIVNRQGVGIDPDRLQAINDFKEPACKLDLQRILGVINYVSKYVPNFSAETKPLRELLKKDTLFDWQQHHKDAFENIKKLLTQSPVLKFFDPNKAILVSVDASQNGLGACLMQENQPVHYASKALTSGQSSQPQITKELLAIWFGLSKFHEYVFGRHVTVETDHKPLIALMKKPLNATPARLQRILLALQKYEFTLTYKRGKDLIIADTLSRACAPDSASQDLDFNDQICVVTEANISDAFLNKVKSETATDPEMQELVRVILTGWPKTNKKLNNQLRPYYRYKSELTVENDIIYKNNSCVIPRKLRKNILHNIHYSHLGYNKCVKLAQESVFWPTIKNEIKLMIDECATCQKYRNSQPPEPLKSHEIPALPWAKVGSDLFEFKGIHYLICVDYYSKYIEVENLGKNMTSFHIINKFKSMFARHGVPQYLVSDGGTQFTSQEFNNFAKQWNFVQQVTSPTHSQSNGMAERHVQTIKNTIKKAIEDHKDLDLTLLQLRNTPMFGGNSPNEILMSRATRNPLLPIKSNKLKPHLINSNEYRKDLVDNQNKQNLYYNRKKGAKELSKLHPQDTVWIQLQPKSIWHPGTVLEQLGDRRYKVKVENKGTYVRNRKFIRPSVLKRSDSRFDKKVNWSDKLVTVMKEEVGSQAKLYIPRLESIGANTGVINSDEQAPNNSASAIPSASVNDMEQNDEVRNIKLRNRVVYYN